MNNKYRSAGKQPVSLVMDEPEGQAAIIRRLRETGFELRVLNKVAN